MTSSRVKGITVQIGGDTTGLDKALKGVNKEISATSSSLKDVERLLKLDPKNPELLRQRFVLLSKEVGQTESKLKALKEAEKQVQQQFERGEIGEEQYDALKREIIATEGNLDKLKSSARDAEKAIAGIDENQIDDVAKAAKDAKSNLEDAGKEASNFGDYLKAEVIVEGAKAIAGALKDVAEETKEYQKIMGSLEISSQEAGYTAEETASTYKQLYGVLGDEQTAATTTANLQAIGLEQNKLVDITNATIGAWAKYGDSIPIDSLSEAINETVKVGKVTGTFADALNWAGVNEDEFNEKLAQCTTDAERADLILNQLSNQGLVSAGEAWRKNNEALVENNEANASLQEQLASLGETVMPIITSVTGGLASILGWFNGLNPEIQNFILIVIALVAAIGPIAGLIQGITVVQQALNVAMAANPIGIIIVLIAALVAAFIYLWNNCEEFREFWINLWENIKEVFSIVWDAIVSFFTETIPNAWQKIVDMFNKVKDWWSGLWNSVKMIFSNVFNGLVDIAKRPVNAIISLFNGVIKGINKLIKGINKIKFNVPDWVPSIGGKEFGFNIKEVGEIAYLAKGGSLVNGTAVIGEAGPEILTVSGGRAMVQPLSGSATAGKGLGELLGLLNTYLPYLAAGTSIVLDNGVLVGEIAPEMNDELGRIAEREKYR